MKLQEFTNDYNNNRLRSALDFKSSINYFKEKRDFCLKLGEYVQKYKKY